MKALVMYNPVAGGGRDALLARFVVALEARGVKTRVYRTQHAGDATTYLRSQAIDADIVIAVGGDGTTNEVINGLPDGIPLGVFATGTANVLAQELSLPKRPEQAAAVIAAGQDVRIWPALIDGRRFMMMAGLGYDAWVVEGVDLSLKQRLGKLAYVLSMLRQIPRYGAARYRLLVDGRPHDCFSAILTNGRYYGGSFLLSRQADISRQAIQVLMFQKSGVGALLRFLLALLFGRMEQMAGVASVAARRVELVSPEGEPVQVDGDLAGQVPVTIEVDQRPLAIRVPVEAARRMGL